VGISGDTPALQSTDARRDCRRVGQEPENEPEIWPLRASTHDVPLAAEANIYTHVGSVMDRHPVKLGPWGIYQIHEPQVVNSNV